MSRLFLSFDHIQFLGFQASSNTVRATINIFTINGSNLFESLVNVFFISAEFFCILVASFTLIYLKAILLGPMPCPS